MENDPLSAHVHDPARLAALHAVALLDTPTEESFDRLTWLAARFVAAPVALVSLVDKKRQFFKSALGLPEPWRSRRETPLSHSFCQYNRIPREPLLVADARSHPIFRDNPAIEDLGVVAYLGIPLVTPDGYVLGSFCVIDSKPRDWSREEVAVVENLAQSVMTEIHLRAEIRTREEMEERLKSRHEELREAYRDLERETARRLDVMEQLRQRDQMLVHQGRITAMAELVSNIAHQWRQPLNILALLAQELPMTYKSTSGEFNAGYLDEKVQQMMGEIGHMSRTIDNFMTFFRPGNERVSFSVAEAVRRTLSLLDETLKEAHITVEVAAASAPVADGYPNEYSQVLLHIVTNARDALVARQVADPRIAIEIAADGARSLVTVTDNAGGIPEQVIGKIFDPYFTTKGPDKGSGLGLYMSKMIIENNMGGSLTVSNVAGGARFRIAV